MARLSYSHQAVIDLARLTDFLIAHDPAAASVTVELIVEAVEFLRHHPFVGRVVTGEQRELVISRGKSGYIALYTVEADGSVLVHAIRHQRESGFSDRL